MKRFVVIAGICLAVGLGVSGCASGTPSQAPQSTVSATGASLTKEGDKLIDTDLQANLFNGSGVKVTIEPAAKTARFQLVDPSSGKDFSDYYVFDYAKQTMLCHRLVSAMQKELLHPEPGHRRTRHGRRWAGRRRDQDPQGAGHVRQGAEGPRDRRAHV